MWASTYTNDRESEREVLAMVQPYKISADEIYEAATVLLEFAKVGFDKELYDDGIIKIKAPGVNDMALYILASNDGLLLFRTMADGELDCQIDNEIWKKYIIYAANYAQFYLDIWKEPGGSFIATIKDPMSDAHRAITGMVKCSPFPQTPSPTKPKPEGIS
jgi:hypothetical protein